ncbi:MAG: 6-phosphogluconolactonase [Cyanobacteria bacterium P01_G01_bin.39]
MKKFLEVLPNRQTLIEKTLAVVTQKIQLAVEQNDICTIALAGGSTPKPLYEALSQQNLPWSKIHVFWGDERYVAVTSPESNQKMAAEAWLNRVDFPPDNLHPIPTNAGNPEVDAQTYENELHRVFKVEQPRFDVILLGIGSDGHTASLFPNTDALKVRDRLVTVGSKDGKPRLTFTVSLINQAHCVIFLAAGEDKRNALDQVLAPAADAMTYPSRLIQPQQGELWMLLDEAAGAEIRVAS